MLPLNLYFYYLQRETNYTVYHPTSFCGMAYWDEVC